jgi:enoyl-CoA hydratase/carnithine racemase
VKTITHDVDGPVGRIQLNRPEKYNAISTGLMSEVSQAVRDFSSDANVVGIVIVGTDQYFSTGADLNEALSIETPQQYSEFNASWREMTGAIERSSKPVFACISGYCYTGGLELALACDSRIAASNASFAITSARIGSVPGAGGTQRLPRLVGPAQAKRMLFSAEAINAHEAYRVGLIDDLVDVGETETKARELIDLYATRAPLSLGWCKAAVNGGLNMDLESGLDLEAVLSSRAFASDDKAEGMAAFLEKRPAKFRGR